MSSTPHAHCSSFSRFRTPAPTLAAVPLRHPLHRGPSSLCLFPYTPPLIPALSGPMLQTHVGHTAHPRLPAHPSPPLAHLLAPALCGPALTSAFSPWSKPPLLTAPAPPCLPQRAYRIALALSPHLGQTCLPEPFLKGPPLLPRHPSPAPPCTLAPQFRGDFPVPHSLHLGVPPCAGPSQSFPVPLSALTCYTHSPSGTPAPPRCPCRSPPPAGPWARGPTASPD